MFITYINFWDCVFWFIQKTSNVVYLSEFYFSYHVTLQGCSSYQRTYLICSAVWRSPMLYTLISIIFCGLFHLEFQKETGNIVTHSDSDRLHIHSNISSLTTNGNINGYSPLYYRGMLQFRAKQPGILMGTHHYTTEECSNLERKNREYFPYILLNRTLTWGWIWMASIRYWLMRMM